MRKISIFLPFAALLVLATGCGEQLQTNTTPPPPAQKNQTAAPAPKPVKITVLASTTLDQKGNPQNPTTVFKKSDTKIYVAVLLNGAKKNDIVSYTRYLNGKYVNSASTRVQQDNVNQVIFAFNKQSGYLPGVYTLKIFVNKAPYTTFNYTVQ